MHVCQTGRLRNRYAIATQSTNSFLLLNSVGLRTSYNPGAQPIFTGDWIWAQEEHVSSSTRR